MAEAALTRRQLLGTGALGIGGLLLGVNLRSAEVQAAPLAGGLFAPDAFIRIASDSRATIIIPQTEMGQGIYTSLTMLIAEELDLPLAGVTIEAAPANDALYGNPILKVQSTGGSTSMRAYWPLMRKAGSSARSMLRSAAARRWKVDPESCRTEAGEVIHDASGKRVAYGAIAVAAMRERPPIDPPLKKPSEFRLIGRSQHRLDTPGKTDGSVQYGIDAMPDGVRFATLACSPVLGGKVAHVDDSQAKGLAGVRQIIVMDDMVAVVGETSWAAMRGLAALDVTWDDGPNASLSTEDLREDLVRAGRQDGHVAHDTGARAKLPGDGLIEAHYELPLLAHAPMEPMNCTVHLTPGRCEVWVGTQVMTMAQRAAAEEAGLTPEQVVVHNYLIGGGFGRRLEVDGVRKAVRIARHVDGPVKVTWSREEDIGKAPYRSLYGGWLKARLQNGMPVAWSHRVAGPAVIGRWLPPAFDGKVDIDAVDAASETPYDLPAMFVDWVRHEPRGIYTGFWRGVGPNMNVFAVESFVDRLAHEAGQDPLQFRRALIGKHARARTVLDLAATKAGWGTPLPAESGRGISLQWAFGTYLCTIAEVSVADDGAVTVRRLTSAVDCGTPVNPDGIISQIQGGHVFGLSAALHGQITLVNGRTQQSNFHDYRVLRIDEVPLIDVHLVRSSEEPGGIGEPGTVSVQGAVNNAIYAATGVQLSRMPVDRSLLRKEVRA
ncbi:xanthine dehydrogenase family protein molybdopterin-binding subunit [Sphingomonas sp. NBWT7]|uniref:xanthine dehydrogenase family protein molybdopterin-binding subunit n=1 Tax=Sphingomonas sp. NBWT7 TaxID=2596913 RepID=UPI001627C335|nr:molybdopterin cofactor-binding domain-containing protein [Sphingomonas sp. NBWT7]QNE31099.1 xanthine dehydrogenase family protein molybdopterin-binding subunit [Sphingomonas sp. NBWT7]